MPKQGWKWRTERIRALTPDELGELVKSNAGVSGWMPKEPRERGWTPRPGRHEPIEVRQAWFEWLGHGKMAPLVRKGFRLLPTEKKRELKLRRSTRISAKLAKWIYRNLAPDQRLYEFNTQQVSSELLRIIAHYPRTVSWRHSFFWNEVDRWKAYEFGERVVGEMPLVAVYDDAPRFVAVYDDETAHPLVRGEAIFGLCYVSHHRAQIPSPSDKWDELIRDTCRRALTDPENPYARCGGCFLVQWIGGFEEEVAALLTDETPEHPGWGPVSRHAKECLEELARFKEEC